MFGIGFGEILVIGLVAFLVVGPKDLPQMAKQFGKWFVKFRRMTFDVRSGVDDFMRQAENELRDEELTALRKELSHTADELKSSVHETNLDMHHMASDLDHRVQEEIETTKKLLSNDPLHHAPNADLPSSLHSSTSSQLSSSQTSQTPETSGQTIKENNQEIPAHSSTVSTSTPYSAPSGSSSANKFETPLDLEEKNKTDS